MPHDIIDKKYLKNIYSKLILGWKKIDSGSFWQLPREKMWNAVKTINTIEDVSYFNLLELGSDCGVHSVIASQRFNSVVAIDKKNNSL